MKTKEELNTPKGEAESLNKKPYALTEEELAKVAGGSAEHILSGVNDGSDHPTEYSKIRPYCPKDTLK